MLATNADRQREIIGERVLLQRRRRKLAQRPLAATLGWGPNRVSDVERAKVDLDVTELYELADALGCTVEYLMGITNEPSAPGGTQAGWTVNTTADLLLSAA